MKADADNPSTRAAIDLRRDEVASALNDTGLQWSPAPDEPCQWRAGVIGRNGDRCEIKASISQDVVYIEAELAAWDSRPSELSRTALQQFTDIVNAQNQLVRIDLKSQSTTVVSRVHVDRVDLEISAGVSAVYATYQLTRRELMALCEPTVAREYLDAMN